MSMKKICNKQRNKFHGLKIGATEPLKLLIKKTTMITTTKDLAAYPQCWTIPAIYRQLGYLSSNLCVIFPYQFGIWTLVKTTMTITTTKALAAFEQCHQIATILILPTDLEVFNEQL